MNNGTKKVAKGTLDLAIVATKAAKYGFNFTFGLSKCMLNGAKSMANSFAPSSFNTGAGDFLLGQAEKAINYGFDKTIQLEKHLRDKVR